MSLVIVGCGLGPDDLTPAMRERINTARVLAGGRRLLDWFPRAAADRVELNATARRQAEKLLCRAQDEEVVVLASGDPLFFGIASTFMALAASFGNGTPVEIVPNVSAVQAACARRGISWSGISFFNLHRKHKSLPWRRILRAPGGALLLAGPGANNPGRLAAEMVSVFPASSERKAIVFSNLGMKDEVVHESALGALDGHDFPSLSLLYIAPAEHSREIPSPAWGLPESEFKHEAGLISKAEVRAVILAKLQLVPGVAWDLGAGSGSVAVEAASMQPGLKVYAVERNETRAALILANAEKHGVGDDLEAVGGDILAVMAELPAPDRVFVGGGGEKIAAVTAAAFARLRPGGVLVTAAVTLESRSELSRVLREACREVVEINISRSRELCGRHLMKAENPIALYVFQKNG